MRIIKTYESNNEDSIDILFVPSGEIITVSNDAFLEIDKLFYLEYSREEKLYFIDDSYRESVMYLADNYDNYDR